MNKTAIALLFSLVAASSAQVFVHSADARITHKVINDQILDYNATGVASSFFETTNNNFQLTSLNLLSSLSQSNALTLPLADGDVWDITAFSGLSDVKVYGAATLRDAALLTIPVTLSTADANLSLACAAPVASTITLAGGQIQLLENLVFTGDGTLSGSGLLVGNGKEITFSSHASAFDANQTFSHISCNVVGDATTAGFYSFVGDTVTSHLTGFDNILDFSTGGTWLVGPNHTLHISSLTLKGIGTGTGGILGCFDNSSTLIFDNVNLELATSYTFSVGTIIFTGRPSTLFGTDTFLYIDSGATLVVDGVAVTSYNTTSTASLLNPYDPVVLSLQLLNGGTIRQSTMPASQTHLIVDDALVTLNGMTNLDVNHTISFRGANSATMVLDGANAVLECARGSNFLITLAASKKVTLQNITLRNFKFDYLLVPASSTLIFGDGVTLELAESFNLNRSYAINGAVKLIGSGISCALNGYDLRLLGKSVLTCQDLSLKGLSPNSGRLVCMQPHAQIILKNSPLFLDYSYNFSRASLDFYGDCSVRTTWATFAYTSTSNLTIHAQSRLFLDRGMTFSYDSAAAVRTGIILEDGSSMFSLCGATLYTTRTGLAFTTGRLIVDENTTFSSEASVDAEGIFIGSGVDWHLAAGSSLRVIGRLVYE